MPDGDVPALVALAAEHAGVPSARVVVTPTSSGAVTARAGEIVAKLHAQQTEEAALAARLRLAGQPGWRESLLRPLVPGPVRLAGSGGRLASVWPRVDVVAHDPDAVPWTAAGESLARLHRRPPSAGVPPHGAVSRLDRGVRALRALHEDPARDGAHHEAGSIVLAAAAGLPASARRRWTPGRPITVVHGDWHLGQLGRLGARWLLIDIDDVGIGDPVWDFERPAAMWAAGVLPDAEWGALVGAYLRAGGPALQPSDGPARVAPDRSGAARAGGAGVAEGAAVWSPALDAVARAGVVQAAAGALRRAALDGRDLDEVDHLLVAACARLSRT